MSRETVRSTGSAGRVLPNAARPAEPRSLGPGVVPVENAPTWLSVAQCRPFLRVPSPRRLLPSPVPRLLEEIGQGRCGGCGQEFVYHRSPFPCFVLGPDGLGVCDAVRSSTSAAR